METQRGDGDGDSGDGNGDSGGWKWRLREGIEMETHTEREWKWRLTQRGGGTDKNFNLADKDSPHFIKRKSTRKYFPECHPNKDTL